MVTTKQQRELLKALWQRIQQHDIVDRAAEMAFWFLLGFFPMILGVASLAARLDTAPGSAVTLIGYLDKVLPDRAALLVRSVLGQMESEPGGYGSRIWLSLGLALWVGMKTMAGMMRTLNVMYGVEERRPWWKARLLATLLSLGFGVLLTGALTIVVDGPKLMNRWLPGVLGVWRAAQWPSAIVLLVLALLGLYRIAPDLRRQGWVRLMPGSVVAATIWVMGSLLFKVYVEHFSHFGRMDGSLGTLVVLMLWFYLGGVAILVGGEINATLEFQGRAGARHSASPRNEVQGGG